MNQMKRILCALMMLTLLLCAVALAETESTAKEPVYYAHDGHVTLIDGACTDKPVTGFEAASDVIDALLPRLGGEAHIVLEPWREITDASGNHYYVFRQMHDNTTVLGGAVKVITDSEGGMIGLTSSIVTDLPQKVESDIVSAEEAEKIVIEYVLKNRQQTLELVEGLTERMILPMTLEIDVEAEDEEGSRYVWVVYTDNPDSRITQSAELPYLAHYVTLDGVYLYSLPTIFPGDEAGSSGFDASYVFEFMEPAEYTGYVDLSTGEEMEISVSVMRDRRTGMYYLGDLERRIVVADCWNFLYNGGQVVLEYSPDNQEWDQVGLLTLYNYCRAYDYYREIGWVGGDGLGTPILVLNNYCDKNHKPVDNAAYVGGYLGWQLFLASQGNDFSQCLDVLCHEFTHCVTGSVMTYNAYMNDYGAINEAISDIQGKTCQLMMEGTETFTWDIANRSLMSLRSMSEPHKGQQPEFMWDLYYMPNAGTPTVLNDEGGVHTNSSLLNYLAWRLYEKGGMTPEEGRAFWFAVDCAMVPGTDYPQLAELLPWVLRTSGLERYEAELQKALDVTRIGEEKIPDFFDDDRALLTLTLPQNEIFDDEQWIMYIFNIDSVRLMDVVSTIMSGIKDGDISVLPPVIQALLNPDEKSEEMPNGFGDFKAALLKWLQEQLNGVFYAASTNAGQDGRVMRMMSKPGYTMPILIHGVVDTFSGEFEDTKLLIYLGGHWLDVNAVTVTDTENGNMPAEMETFTDKLIENISKIRSVDDAMQLLFWRVQGGTINEVPSDGLDTIQPTVSDIFDAMNEAEVKTPVQRKSRPKQE